MMYGFRMALDNQGTKGKFFVFDERVEAVSSIGLGVCIRKVVTMMLRNRPGYYDKMVR